MNETDKLKDQAQPQVVSLYAKRKKIYAKEAKGLFASWRWVLVWFTQLLFYGLLWLEWNGRQAVLFHLVERKFYLFGLVLWPQDVFYLALILIISAYSLFLFTAVAGRLFCGYACPQTVYTEMFMWIENRIEGDRVKRMKLDAQPASARKFLIKTSKHVLWALLGLWTGFTLVGYFTPVKELMHSFASWQLGPWETFWIFFYGFFTYFMAGFMREQMCKYACPYARFQGVMFDPDTLVITYDPERGEPRGVRKKSDPDRKLGDCVDCGICVQVCPVGIDIRDGLQYECIGCAACIDACDQVMAKTGKPKGLIRYSTENALEKHYTFKEILSHVARPRIMIYTSILGAIILASGISLAMRKPLKVDVIRDRAVASRETETGQLENIYLLRFMNTDEQAHKYRVTVSGLKSAVLDNGGVVEVPSASTKEFTMAVRINPDDGKKGSNPIFFEIRSESDPSISLNEKAAFLVQ